MATWFCNQYHYLRPEYGFSLALQSLCKGLQNLYYKLIASFDVLSEYDITEEESKKREEQINSLKKYYGEELSFIEKAAMKDGKYSKKDIIRDFSILRGDISSEDLSYFMINNNISSETEAIEKIQVNLRIKYNKYLYDSKDLNMLENIKKNIRLESEGGEDFEGNEESEGGFEGNEESEEHLNLEGVKDIPYIRHLYRLKQKVLQFRTNPTNIKTLNKTIDEIYISKDRKGRDFFKNNVIF